MCLIFFFFKQKTAYEMRISDWSSDVCSSDLRVARHPVEADDESEAGGPGALQEAAARGFGEFDFSQLDGALFGHGGDSLRPACWPHRGWRYGCAPRWRSGRYCPASPRRCRSEERRVGKERFSTCRYRWSTYH